MSFRVFNPSTTTGYGVSTRQIIDTNADIQFSVADILINADLPAVLSQLPINPNTYALAVHSSWRVKIFDVEFNPSGLKTYNARNGRAKYGEYVVGSNVYFSDQGFISLVPWISPLFRSSFIIILGPPMRELPLCDEPPVDLDLPTEEGRYWYPYTNGTRSSFAQFNSVAGEYTDTMGDSFFAYMDISVTASSAALTYTFAASQFDLEEFVEFFPRAILL